MDGGSRKEDKIIKVEEVVELRGSLVGWVVHGAAECACGQVCVNMNALHSRLIKYSRSSEYYPEGSKHSGIAFIGIFYH